MRLCRFVSRSSGLRPTIEKLFETAGIVQKIAYEIEEDSASITRFNYATLWMRINFRECMAKTGGVAGYVEDFCHVLSEI